VGAKLCKPRYARSALGPCRNGRARAWAVANGRLRFGGTAGRGPFGSSSWDNVDGRFGLWSRRSSTIVQNRANSQGLSTVKIAASAPAVRLGPELALKLHQGPGLGAVGADVGLDCPGSAKSR
jgi:hypothetical protein